MGEMTLREALDEYKNVYMAYRNFAERTRVEYQNDLEDFIDFLKRSGIEKARELNLSAVMRYSAELEQRGFASLTRKRKVVTIRSFLTFLYQDGHIDTDIAKKVIVPFTETTTPNILTQSECDRLRDACADNPRDRVIVELLLQTGIKLSELTRLTLSDIEFEKAGEEVGGFVRVAGRRGKKDRMIPLNSQACLSLKSYIQIREDWKNNTLFLNRFDEPLGDRGVQKIFRKYLAKAGVGKASIQTLRHTFGIQQMINGKTQKNVQEIMGLRDSRSASIYASLFGS